MATDVDKLEVINAAMVLIGDDPIESIEYAEGEDAIAAVVVANALYETVVQSALSTARWRFATNIDLLNEIAEELNTTNYTSAFAIPPDAISIHSVQNARRENVDFDRINEWVVTDEPVGTALYMTYGYRADERDWTPRFRLYLIHLLAHHFAISLSENASLAEVLGKNAETLRARAVALDAQERTTRKIDTGSFIRARRNWRR